jgi:hypothetical protein
VEEMPDPLQELLKVDLEGLGRDLQQEVDEGRLSTTDVQDILSLFPDLHFPGLMTVLALGARTGRREPPITPFPLTKQNIINALARLSVSDEQAQQVSRLLLTGQLFGALAHAFAAIFHVIPGLPLAIARDVRTLPRVPRRLALAIKRDLGDAPSLIETVQRDLRKKGTIDSQPPMLTHTMEVLYRRATPKQVATTIYDLLGNESVRLAIIVFATSRGLNISHEDLDLVREAIDPDRPNLGKLLAPGYRHLLKHFGYAQAIELLDQFVA